MNTRFLETFVWLTRLRSFSRAAEKLNASQPAISNRMHKLEELLGVRLYDRTARQFELTPAGRRILGHAEQIVTLSSELRELAASDDEIDVKLRIGVIELITMSWLPEFLERAVSAFPKTALQIGTATSPALVQKLREDELDLIFAVGPINEPNVLSFPVSDVGLSWVGDPSRFDCQTEIDVLELSRMQILMPKPGSSGYDVLRDYFRSFGVINIASQDQRLVVDCIYSLGTATQLARAGLGVISIPTFCVKDDLASGRLAEIKVRQPLPSLHVTACCKQPLTSKLVTNLIAMAREAALDYAAPTTAASPGTAARRTTA
jgi:DNA-binding transcriptional LysR family regulator